ncbi:hypothetical protein PQE16_gp55 [Arthrobacter phage Reedo]|uniref:Uncharacterized protein n=1 Tax=Arthrobacter phage Reedo TaxID=2910755 RepID=A0AA49H0V5_9CAUD|nr:hypothetical protein PQE16_gp55 [Arthrobacter phage Reedo]UJQ86845.1 hypothetical protein SEA_REEDO_55 [Arthrobacter phage Reedo]
MATKVTYHTNNSGGGWWLTDDDWKALEAAGWDVDWYADQTGPWHDGGDRFLGALATAATRTGLSLDDAIAEWERVTGERAEDEGCDCCGQPHYFSEEE